MLQPYSAPLGEGSYRAQGEANGGQLGYETAFRLSGSDCVRANKLDCDCSQQLLEYGMEWLTNTAYLTGTSTRARTSAYTHTHTHKLSSK
jgi:hypothetical protein